MPTFIHGWIPDAEAKKAKDYSAHPILNLAAAPPPSASVRKWILDIFNQENLGSCVANAGAQAIRAALVRAGLSSPEALSRLFAYYYARAISPGDTTADTGTQIRCFFDVVRKLGYCPESVWPYDVEKFATMPSDEALRAAYDQATAIGYFRISSTGAKRVQDVCTAIASGFAVVFGTLVGNDFVLCQNPATPFNPPTGAIAGGHALTITDYWPGPAPGTVDFGICNSWGPAWGQAGFCTFTDAYIAWEASSDFWIVQTAQPFSGI